MSKDSPTKNCWAALKSLPVYHVPPPLVISEELIDPVVPAVNCADVVDVPPPKLKVPVKTGVNTFWSFPSIELVVTV